MKHTSFLVLFLCLIAGAVRAANVTGTVTDQNANPVTGQSIIVTDSLNTFSLTATTGAGGTYSVTLPSNVPIGMQIEISTPACGIIMTSYAVYTGASITSNFVNQCPSTSSYVLQGNVTLSGVANNGVADLYLIEVDYDSAVASWTLTAIDTITTTSTGTFSQTYTSYPGVTGGGLLLKAALRGNHPNYAAYLPTYYTSSLVWSGATNLSASNFIGNAMTNINMTAGTNPGGPGFIGGSVLQGANKTAGVGDPLSSRLLLLTTMTGQPVSYAYSNASGQFSFPNIAYGTYKLFGDAWGKQNPALIVTISAGQPSVANITFEENSTSFVGHVGGLGIRPVSGLQGVKVFPNPATDVVSLSGLSGTAGDKAISLRSMNGAIISQHQVASGVDPVIPTDALPAGIYILDVHTEQGTTQFKIVK
jgi:hypothetical protein